MKSAILFTVMMSLACSLAATRTAIADDEADALIQRAREALAQGDVPQALSLTTKAIRLAPRQTRGWLLRAQLYGLRREHARAAADYGEVIKLDAAFAPAWQARGEAHFKSGKITESIADFDEFLKRVPDQKPHHWQRGISLYYAGRFVEGQQQFEVHQTVNPHDVENAVWHFLCTVRAESLEAAKKKLIPIEGDARVPMSQVHRLFAGKGTVQEVLAAAQTAPPTTRAGEPRFYANLYLGLYYEAIDDRAKARDYIERAAERSQQNGYMGEVARVHAEILRKRRARR